MEVVYCTSNCNCNAIVRYSVLTQLWYSGSINGHCRKISCEKCLDMLSYCPVYACACHCRQRSALTLERPERSHDSHKVRMIPPEIKHVLFSLHARRATQKALCTCTGVLCHPHFLSAQGVVFIAILPSLESCPVPSRTLGQWPKKSYGLLTPVV